MYLLFYLRITSKRKTLSGQEGAFVSTYNVSSTVQYRSENVVWNRFFLGSGGENGTKLLCVAKVLWLRKINVRKASEPAYFVFITFMECTKLLDEVGKALVCMA